ncbi:hypothetical protein CEXT_206031 [Caerostris extrusa]|uniref:Uncharacterized protein n=1 Tax=Caerostris extrusa TaxID=172846 RepID=A0AAV4TNF6_CAEEX|nr:hypothetical protein CEXT_206031 [Caerostris extrusa]
MAQLTFRIAIGSVYHSPPLRSKLLHSFSCTATTPFFHVRLSTRIGRPLQVCATLPLTLHPLCHYRLPRIPKGGHMVVEGG